jgi:hypothetical protein
MKKVISRNTLLTELIIDDGGKSYIIKRIKENNSHSELISPEEGRLQLTEWEKINQWHQKELEKENQPHLFQLMAEGEKYALKHIIELHKDDKEGGFGIKNIWWDGALNWFKSQAIEIAIGALKALVKDQIPNMIKLADWLTEQMESEIVKGYQKLAPEFQGVIKNELKQYPQFSRLLEKLN